MSDLNGLFEQKIQVINLGLPAFYKDLQHQEIPVVQVDWNPPARGNKKLQSLLGKLKK